MIIKHVQLKDFDLKDIHNFKPNKDIEIKWQKDDDMMNASFIGNNKAEINNQLANLSNNIASERLRTLNQIPKFRIITSQHRRKMEMRQEVKEIY